MVEVRKEYGSRFLQRVSYSVVDCSCRLMTHLEIALLFRVGVVVSPPLGRHGLELEHGGCDVRAVAIDYCMLVKESERAGKAAVKWLRRRTDGVQTAGNARSSD